MNEKIDHTMSVVETSVGIFLFFYDSFVIVCNVYNLLSAFLHIGIIGS